MCDVAASKHIVRKVWGKKISQCTLLTTASQMNATGHKQFKTEDLKKHEACYIAHIARVTTKNLISNFRRF